MPLNHPRIPQRIQPSTPNNLYAAFRKAVDALQEAHTIPTRQLKDISRPKTEPPYTRDGVLGLNGIPRLHNKNGNLNRTRLRWNRASDPPRNQATSSRSSRGDLWAVQRSFTITIIAAPQEAAAAAATMPRHVLRLFPLAGSPVRMPPWPPPLASDRTLSGRGVGGGGWSAVG